MFGDELLEATVGGERWVPVRLRLDAKPLLLGFPGVFDGASQAREIDRMAQRHSHIVFCVCEASHERDGEKRNDFTDEHYAAADFAAFAAANVDAEINLVKI